MKTPSRSRLLLSALAGFGLIIGAQGQAHASTVVQINVEGGWGIWNDDPSRDGPGDSIRACDYKADGWAIEFRLDTNHDGYADRTVSTRGHASPYCSPWKGGDLPEGRTFGVALLQVKGTTIGKVTEGTVHT